MKDAIVTVQDYLDQVALPVTGLQVELAFVGDTEPHKHRKHQLLYVLKGFMSVQTEQGVWAVPPQCAIWIPAEVMHFARATQQASIANLYIEAQPPAHLEACGILFTRPLLRELILRLVQSGEHLPGSELRHARLIAVLMDELALSPQKSLHLPMPGDRRLKRLIDHLAQSPGLKLSMEQWGALIGVSTRTLGRLFLRETGMSFGRWLQQWDSSMALQKLANGTSVTATAQDLGYESLSAFITMFRRTVGTTPARFFAQTQTLPVESNEQPCIHMDGRVADVFSKIHVPMAQMSSQ